MKKNFFLNSAQWMLIFSVFVSAVVSSCKKKDDPTPAPSSTAKVFTSVVTPQKVSDGSANVIGTVTTTDGNAYLRLDLTSVYNTSTIDHVYVTLSQDNGPMAAYYPGANYTDSLKNTFTAGSNSTKASYTTSNTKNFVLMIPVSIRTTAAAVSDVYTVWFTNGKGDFVLPAKNRTAGPVTFTLNYKANAAPSFQTVSVLLGDQNATPGSLLVTSGQVSALLTAAYDSSASSADLSLSELNSTGDARTGAAANGYTGGNFGSGSLWFISPSERANVGYKNEPGSNSSNFQSSSSPNITYISLAPGTINFDAVTGTDLSNLSVGTNEKIQLTSGGVYQFQTSSTNGAPSKKGLIKITSLTQATSSAGGTAQVTVKVLN